MSDEHSCSVEPDFPSIATEKGTLNVEVNCDSQEVTPQEEEKYTLRDSAQAAEEERQVLASYMDSYISIMRIKFAWMAFVLVVILLIVDLFIVFSTGINNLSLIAVFIIIGAFVGMLIGMMHCHVSNSNKIIADIESAKSDKTKRLDNLRLMVWRGYGHRVWILMLIGGISGSLFSRGFFISGNHPHNIEFSNLHDQVVIALIVSTTASVIGILLIVMYWLFPKDKKNKYSNPPKLF